MFLLFGLNYKKLLHKIYLGYELKFHLFFVIFIFMQAHLFSNFLPLLKPTFTESKLHST